MIKASEESHRLGFSKRVVISSVVVLLIFLTIFLVDASPSPELNDDSVSESSTERTSLIDFDTFVNGAPEGMEVSVGATTGETNINNLIERDSTTFFSSVSSLSIAGCDETTNWRMVSIDIPSDVRCVTARLFAKGEGLGQDLNQYNNCFAGFWCDDLLGGTGKKWIWFPTGTFDWEEFTVSLDIETNLAENVRFLIFSSISGTLWIDDLTFIYDDGSCVVEESDLPEPLSAYITDLSRPTTFLELAPQTYSECPYSISASEAMQDIEMLRYLFTNAYSGYEYWENQGVDFSAVCDRLVELTDGNDSVSVIEMENIIAESLEGIQDGHFSVSGHQTYRFLSRKNPYFADVIVERDLLENGEVNPVGEYRVVLSNTDSVQPGMIYAGPQDGLFRILSRSGVEQFQLGVFSCEYECEAVFQFLADSSDIEMTGSDHSESMSGDSTLITSISLHIHECRLNRIAHQDEQVYYRTEIEGIDLIRVSSFAVRHHEALQEFAESGADLAETDQFIVDLMGNNGGSSIYGGNFISGLNGVAQWRMYYAMLCSPATVGSYAAISITEGMPPGAEETVRSMQQALEHMQEKPVRNWLYVSGELPARQMGEYEGCAVLLIDRAVASSGEAFIDYSKSVPGAVLIGENSAGVGTFGEVRQYWLPYSRLSLNLPSKLFLSPEFEEGVGYIPDYWLDSPKPVAEIARWLNNPDSYQFEFPLPQVLHDLSFDEFDQGLPLYMNVRVGATSGYEQQYSTISRDCEIKTGGSSSLRIEGDIDTDYWNSLSLDVPQDIGTLSVKYNVRGENIHCESNQYDNCYVGFIYSDSEGNRQFNTNSYEGSFDWKQDSLQLNIEEFNASGVEFHFFLSKSGTLWIDDVVFSE